MSSPEAIGFIKTLVNIWTSGWANYVEVMGDDRNMVSDYLKTGPKGMADNLLDSHAEDLKMGADNVSQEIGLHLKEIYHIIVPMIKNKMDKIMTDIGITENKCTLKQDVFMEYNGHMITIPKNTVLREVNLNDLDKYEFEDEDEFEDEEDEDEENTCPYCYKDYDRYPDGDPDGVPQCCYEALWRWQKYQIDHQY